MPKSGPSTATQVYDVGHTPPQKDVPAPRLLRQCVGPKFTFDE